jgi:hypothetical protein
MVRVTVRLSGGAVIATNSGYPEALRHEQIQAEFGVRGGQRPALPVEAAAGVVGVDHRRETLRRQRGLAARAQLERLAEEALGQPVLGAGPALAQVVEALREHDSPRRPAQLVAGHVPARDGRQ